MAIHKPSWFSESHVVVSTAPTCGLTKGGRTLPLIDKKTGARIKEVDPDTGELVDKINDCLLDDVESLMRGGVSETLHKIDAKNISMRLAVPIYYDKKYENEFKRELEKDDFSGFSYATIGELLEDGVINISGGHGSPSADQRIGDVPYIKVSDLRAGLVNINPTNRVPRNIAEKHWRGDDSGLEAFSLLSPERTSKNIGDFCILLPGQEHVLLTKEILVIKPGENADFDSFYLLWALTLKIVRNQWKRIIFMQTNREDVGKRYLEILVPVPKSRSIADEFSEEFRVYYKSLAESRARFAQYLASSDAHHFYMSGAEPPEEESIV